jgi:dTDP-4-amino-4,6-dideoxygalactose transaminase
MNNRCTSRVEGWMKEHFPRHPHIYFGLSGTALLLEVFQRQPRSTVVLPAFFCPNISTAALMAGKRVMHIDADRRTQLPDVAQLERCLASVNEADTILLIDHSFGYPFIHLSDLRRRFPKLLIIEDCARALGVESGASDFILFSMYKTTAGSSNGAVLASAIPLGIEPWPGSRPSARERVANLAPLRYAYHLLQRIQCSEFRSRAGQVNTDVPPWTPQYGMPHQLCSARFFSELDNIQTQTSTRRAIADEIIDGLSGSGIECIKPAEGHQTAGHFLSVRVGQQSTRDLALTRLRKKSLSVARTWDIIPAHFRCFENTFPFGCANSKHLAEQMIHVRLAEFRGAKQRRSLIDELRAVTQNLAALPEKASVASFS